METACEDENWWTHLPVVHLCLFEEKIIAASKMRGTMRQSPEVKPTGWLQTFVADDLFLRMRKKELTFSVIRKALRLRIHMSFLPRFPYFEKTKRSLWTHLTHYLSVYPPLIHQSSPVNCCWASPAQSLVSGPIGAHDIIYVRFKTVYVFGNAVSDERRGLIERYERYIIGQSTQQ
jgi:hypothetical protein